jgi:hypothetical protein
MKKITLTVLLLVSTIKLYSQNIFNENFETTTNLSSSGWRLYNDTHTLNNGYDSIFTHAWEIVEWAEETPNKAASTSSAFIESGPANRWLVTPSITIPANALHTILTFKARSFDVAPRQDGFKLKISTTTNSKTSFTTTILSVPNTPNTLLNQVIATTVDLSSYAGQTIYLAWVDDFEGGNILAIDDIDITVNGLSTNQFTANTFSIYPNPSNGNFNIKAVNTMNEIRIYDIVGKLIYSKSIDSENEEIKTSNLAKGIYVVSIELENGNSSKHKIIIE